ncbi:ribose pyranase [Pseudomonas oryzihabitans]|uniref:D-ribose pyranase n=1 Tax=Pseudomonas oryzihabitans TaxID=47885 RepID=A0A0U4W0A0_9PSED|nr:D-ribose pyranase [Pseudomonas oryzihabitans]ALZ84792.1 ribose pyranase [Pseudomonas oryzihabitans]
MKKTPLLNIALSQAVASLGHGDLVVIGDAGMPVPPGTPLVDLAVTPGVPDFLSVLRALLSEMQVESHLLAEESLVAQPPALAELEHLTTEGALGTRRLVSHAEMKTLCRQARVQIRTGECQPYTNLILVAGVAF